MSDDEQPTDGQPTDGQSTDGQPTAARSAAASATRRARRIAVKPPAAAEPTTPADAVPAEEPTVVLTKAADPPTAPEPAADEDADSAPGAARWLPAAVLILAAITMGVLTLTFSHSVWWAKPAAHSAPHSGAGGSGGASTTDNALREKVLAATKECVVATNKYNYATFDADEAAGVKCTTGAESTQYKSAMEHLIRGPALKIKATQVPQINTAGIESVTADGKQWSILVYGQLAVHSQTAKARIDPFAAVARMDYVNGAWLMSNLQPLAEPAG